MTDAATTSMDEEGSVGSPAADDDRRLDRVRAAWRLLSSMIRLHPRLFAAAVAGAAVFAVCTVLSSFAVRWVIDNVILPRFEQDPQTGDVVGSVDVEAYVVGVVLVVGIGVLRAIGVVFRRGFGAMTMWRVAESHTNAVIARLVRQPMSWHRRRADGDLVARAGVDAEASVSVLAPIPFVLSTISMVIVSTVWLLATDVPLGIIAVVAFPILIGTNVVYERKVAGHYRRAQDQLGDFSAAVHESFEGVQLVKAYGAEERETRRLSALAADVRDTRITAIRIRSWFEALLDVLPQLTNVGLVVMGAIRVDAGAVTVGEFTSFVFLFTLLVFPLRLIGYALAELPRSMAGWERIQEVLEEELEPDPARLIESAPPGVGVQLVDVSFGYAGAILRDVDLEVPVGSVTAVVGATGSGKSTLALVLLGLEEPDSGQVRLADGGRAVVFQEAFLLAGTVRENVTLGGNWSDDDIWDALDHAAARDFVEALPHGLDTVVGERGVSLSGGQRQRVALARALLRRPAVLVLDDTTSALDPATEARVLDGLRSGLDDTTVIMIASRPSTIALADDVVFIVGGRIAAHGTHDELIASKDEYRRLVEAFEADRDGAR